jgi:hypothetical protein
MNDSRYDRRKELEGEFLPESHLENRVPNALEYIAFYLEKIEAHLKRIADRLDKS